VLIVTYFTFVLVQKLAEKLEPQWTSLTRQCKIMLF